MAEVCTPTMEGVSSMAPHPLNLSLLRKKRAMDEEDMYEHDTEHSCSSKRSKREHENSSETDEKQEDIVVDDYKEDFHAEGDKSKSSILQHFYSFIRRKTDDTNSPNTPQEETAINRERVEILPTSAESDADRLRQIAPHLMMERASPLAVPPEKSLFDYNTALSRHIAARGGPATFMDIWNAMTVSALARAKSNGYKEQHRTSPPFPNVIGLSGDYEQKANLPTSASTAAIPERTMRQNNWAVKVRFKRT